MLGQPPPTPAPFIIKLVEPKQPTEWQRLSDVLLGSLGVTGLIVLGAVVLGTAMAAILFWIRSRER